MRKQVAIVTGVSRLNGIGKAICVELAKNGCDIFFTYWRNYDKEMPWTSADDEPDLIAFLASEQAAWVTGQIIHSEGGFIREKY